MGRPRGRSVSVSRASKTSKARRLSARAAPTPPGSDCTGPRTPENYELINDAVDVGPSMEPPFLALFDAHDSQLMPPDLSWTPPSLDSISLQPTAERSLSIGPSPCCLPSTSFVDEVCIADLLASTEPSSLMSDDVCAWSLGLKSPPDTRLQQFQAFQDIPHDNEPMQLSKILYDLRTISHTLKAQSSVQIPWNHVIKTVSSLCDISKSSKSTGNINSRLPSAELVIVATMVPVVVELYSVLASELSSTCNSWTDQQRPGTQALLESHSYAFAMNMHLQELRGALDSAGVATYDAHTAQATDRVHMTIKDLLRRWQFS